MSSLLTSLVAFAIIFAGAFLGMFIRNRLPGHHLSGDTKDVVRLGTGLIGTMAALVLGLADIFGKQHVSNPKYRGRATDR